MQENGVDKESPAGASRGADTTQREAGSGELLAAIQRIELHLDEIDERISQSIELLHRRMTHWVS